MVPRRAVKLVLPSPPIGGATHVLQVTISDRFVLFELPDNEDRPQWSVRLRVVASTPSHALSP